MTGYESKRAAAQDKLDDDDTQVYQDHDDALTIAYQSGYYDGKKAAAQEQKPVGTFIKAEHGDYPILHWHKPYVAKVGDNLYTTPPQRPWVGLTEGEWFKCWLILQAVDETEAEFDFADFLIIAQAVVANLKGKNT